MRPALWTGMFCKFNIPLEDTIRRLSEVGFRAAELCEPYLDRLSHRTNSLESARKLRALCNEREFSLSQAHGPTLAFASSDRAAREEACARVESLFPLLEILGVTTVVLHPDQPEVPQAKHLNDAPPWTFAWNNCISFNGESFRRLSNVSGKFGIQIAVENLIDGKDFERQVFGARPIDLEMLLTEAPELGMNLDTAHGHTQHLDLPAIIQHCGPRLYGLHVSDNHGEPYDKHLIPGKGTIDWPRVISALKVAGYQGDFHLELPHERDDNIETTTRAAQEAYLTTVNLLESL